MCCSPKVAISSGFFSLRLKYSRPQKLKLKVFKAQTQEYLVKKLKKSETLGAILAQKFKIPMKIDVLEEILTNLSKTQGFFHNSSPKSLKNSRFRKVHLLTLPKKRLKKDPGLVRQNLLGIQNLKAESLS